MSHIHPWYCPNCKNDLYESNNTLQCSTCQHVWIIKECSKENELPKNKKLEKEQIVRPQVQQVVDTMFSLLRGELQTQNVPGYCQDYPGIILQFEETTGVCGIRMNDVRMKNAVSVWCSTGSTGKNLMVGCEGTTKFFAEMIKKALRENKTKMPELTKNVQFYLDHTGESDHYFWWHHDKNKFSNG